MRNPSENPDQQIIINADEVKTLNSFGVIGITWQSVSQRNSNGDIVANLRDVELTTKGNRTYRLPKLAFRKRAGAISFDVDLTDKFTLAALFEDEGNGDESNYAIEA